MLTKHAFLIQYPIITVLMRNDNINEENLRIVEAFFLFVFAAVGPLAIATGVYSIIKKRPLPGYYDYSLSPGGAPRYCFPCCLKLILAGIITTGIALWGISVFWNVSWLAWMRSWYALAAGLILLSIAVIMSFPMPIHLKKRLSRGNLHRDEDRDEQSDTKHNDA